MKNSKKVCLIILILLLIIYLILSFLEIIPFIPCIFHELTGLYCPGCGISRMIVSIFNFDFYQAFRFNPLAFVLFPLIVYCIVEEIFKIFFNKHFKFKISNKIWIVLLIITITFGILRNIPFFDFLRPVYV